MTTSNCGLPDGQIHPHVDRCYQAGVVDALREAADALEASLGGCTCETCGVGRRNATILRNRADQIARNESMPVAMQPETCKACRGRKQRLHGWAVCPAPCSDCDGTGIARNESAVS